MMTQGSGAALLLRDPSISAFDVLKRSPGLAQDSSEILRAIINICPTEVAILDAECRMVMANAPLVRRVGAVRARTWPKALAALISSKRAARQAQNAVAAVCSGDQPWATVPFAGKRPDGSGASNIRAESFAIGDSRWTAVFVTDATDIEQIVLEKRAMANQLLHSEDMERRRIARELHDSTVQDLIAIKLTFKRLQHLEDDPLATSVFDDIKGALTQALCDLRTLSFLLHPPVIGEMGLSGALSALASGLSSRMDMRIVFHDDTPSTRYGAETEFALYRVAQEALTNVYRHASADAVSVRLLHRQGWLVLEIEDDGVGIQAADGRGHEIGVGIQCMRSRVQELGGKLRIVRLEHGTLVRASISMEAVLS